MTTRQVIEVQRARASQDGAGVAIQRIAGMRHAAMDPVLMIDELRSEQRDDFAAGFPPHPHRGMQTLTYMKHGGIIHEDNQGNRGEIRGGGVQWMSAGRGIIHSEMPTQDTRGLHGFQLWFNLPAAEKMHAPRYRDIPAGELAKYECDGQHAIAIAGDWTLGDTRISGPLVELVPQADMLDLTLQADAVVTVESALEQTLIAYVYDGSLVDQRGDIASRHLAITGEGEGWELRAGKAGVGLLLLRGTPLREPVANYGPFVMNTPAEIEQALRDYQAGNFGG
ncbi:MAG: pirin family protein [Chromatocurvus sp.]